MISIGVTYNSACDTSISNDIENRVMLIFGKLFMFVLL